MLYLLFFWSSLSHVGSVTVILHHVLVLQTTLLKNSNYFSDLILVTKTRNSYSGRTTIANRTFNKKNSHLQCSCNLKISYNPICNWKISIATWLATTKKFQLQPYLQLKKVSDATRLATKIKFSVTTSFSTKKNLSCN
jgi:hypothetical protein